MKAYAILDGGGVKGAALAGALQAAQEFGIEFEGYGGTSAGSIVALLAAIGYSGKEITDIMTGELDVSRFLDDGGMALDHLSNLAGKLRPGGLNFRNAFHIGRALWTERDVIRPISEKFGLYHADGLREFLLKKIHCRIPTLEGKTDISFDDLCANGCKDLKIVASDIKSYRPVLFSRDGYGRTLVLRAVRASISYPFVFQPVKEEETRYWVDGGISSNLPVFLFERERRERDLPVFAFDLETFPPDSVPNQYGIREFLRDLLATSLEASDELLRQGINGLYHIRIKIPANISTFDFSLSKDQLEDLAARGRADASSYLSTNLFPWRQARNKVESVQAQRNTEPRLVKQMLEVIAKDVERQSPAKEVRCYVTLPTEWNTQIVSYQYGMDENPDSDLELETDGGCSGQAWSLRQPSFDDLSDLSSNFQKRNMTRDQQNKIPKDRKAVMSVPIFEYPPIGKRVGGTSQRKVLGTLSLDTTTPLTDTGWVPTEQNQVVINRTLVWADILSKLLT